MPVTIPLASEMLAAGLEAALAEALRLINLNCAHGSVALPLYPKVIAQHVIDRLKTAGYEITRKGAHVVASWTA